jgi:hypothetical protein
MGGPVWCQPVGGHRGLIARMGGMPRCAIVPSGQLGRAGSGVAPTGHCSWRPTHHEAIALGIRRRGTGNPRMADRGTPVALAPTFRRSRAAPPTGMVGSVAGRQAQSGSLAGGAGRDECENVPANRSDGRRTDQPHLLIRTVSGDARCHDVGACSRGSS